MADAEPARTDLHPEALTGTSRKRRDDDWLRLHRQGWSAGELTMRSGCSLRYVQRRLACARRAEKKAAKAREVARRGTLPPALFDAVAGLVPLFPMGGTPYTTESKCPHFCGGCRGEGKFRRAGRVVASCLPCLGTGRAAVRAGSVLCCMVCHSTGYDPAIKAHDAAIARRAARDAARRAPVAA